MGPVGPPPGRHLHRRPARRGEGRTRAGRRPSARRGR
jgi:hypothetical protein